MYLKITLICLLILFSVNAGGLARAESNKIELPSPKHAGGISVEEAIYKRKSIRDYAETPLSLEEVSQVLWAAGGMTVDGITGPTRAYASAGGRYPLEIYLVVGKVDSLTPGIYRYDWADHSITLLKKGDFRADLARASSGQRMIAQAPFTVVITTTPKKAEDRYGKRGIERYVYLDAGHLGQNVHLQAESLGLGTVMVGAYTDSEVAGILGVKGEVPVYVMPIGYPEVRSKK
jgi:SagB-type dehydrogenase family enzyme